MRPTETEIGKVVRGWTCLKFFPSEPSAIGPIAKIIASMVGTVEQLRWLDSVMLNQVGEWPGPAEVRAIFCTRFRPEDGDEVKGYSAIAGFTPGDIEGEKLVEHSRLTEGRREFGQIGAGEMKSGAQLLALLPVAKLLGDSGEPPITNEERASIEALNQRNETRIRERREAKEAEKQKRLDDLARRQAK